MTLNVQKILAAFDTMQEIAYFDVEGEEGEALLDVDVVSKGRAPRGAHPKREGNSITSPAFCESGFRVAIEPDQLIELLL